MAGRFCVEKHNKPYMKSVHKVHLTPEDYGQHDTCLLLWKYRRDSSYVTLTRLDQRLCLTCASRLQQLSLTLSSFLLLTLAVERGKSKGRELALFVNERWCNSLLKITTVVGIFNC